MKERFGLVLALTAVLLLWLLTILFFSFERSPHVALAISGVIFLLFCGLLTLFLRKAFKPGERSERQQALISAGKKNSAQTKTAAETAFVTETMETVLAQMREQQRALTDLQNKISERAASAEVFSHHIVNSLPSGLIAFDAQGRVKIANDPAREIFPLLGEINKLNAEPFLLELFADSSQFVELISASLNEGKIHSRLEVDYQTREQTKKLGLTVAPLIIESEICGALCLVADISEIARLREQFERQRNLESLGVMSAGLAHELKNALATLSSYAQFLGRSAEKDQTKKAATALNGEIKNLSQMINSFLNFARPQNLSLSAVETAELVSECLTETLLYAQESQVISEMIGEFAVVQADRSLLRQTILNLLRNGIEAAADSIDKNIQVKGYLSDDENGQKWLNIEVSDSGSGIKTEDLDFIFIPFFTTKQNGHGIGLALSHRIVTQHQGFLLAENKPPRGASLTIKLKAHTAN